MTIAAMAQFVRASISETEPSPQAATRTEPQ
jgi:hypothetical protein